MMGFALRCDRILWKSTIEPGPDSDYGEPEALFHRKSGTRIGRFFANFVRYGKNSHNSFTSSEPSNHGHAPPVPSRYYDSTPSPSVPGSPIPIPEGRQDSIPFSQLINPKVSAEIVRSGSVENPNVGNAKRTPGVGLIRSFSVDQAQTEGKHSPKHRRPSRAWTTPTKPRPLSSIPLSTEPVPTTATPKDGRRARNGPQRWRFLPFFWGDSSQAATTADPVSTSEESPEMTVNSTSYKPRKGDVICLGYDSLDDKAMRRLEGRSDHRPVIGSFAIFL
jgi:hypothetical protein